MEIKGQALKDLKNFLWESEENIAVDWEDFGKLRNVFVAIFGREPSEK